MGSSHALQSSERHVGRKKWGAHMLCSRRGGMWEGKMGSSHALQSSGRHVSRKNGEPTCFVVVGEACVTEK